MADSVRGRLGCSILVLIVIALCGCDNAILNYREGEQGLLFSEVYLERDNQKNNWLEVYNPTGNPLLLSKFRTSCMLCMNCLSDELVHSGELLLRPGHRLILCLDRERFTQNWGWKIRAVEVDMLFFGGGFMVLGTYATGDSGIDGFRFGDPGASEGAASWAGNQALGFCDDGYSWSRNIIITQSGIETSGFRKAIPTPGEKNNY
ncbi:hypothetical protein ACFL6I_01260 [candidate division KSB1 bacterium]